MRALSVVALGGGLYALFAIAEGMGGLGLVASALLEECGKFALLVGLAATAARKRNHAAIAKANGDALCLGLVAIGLFATIENLAYFLAFPARDILARLLWSEPVHLVCGFFEAAAAGVLATAARRREKASSWLRPCLEAVSCIAFALAWHLGFNLLAAADPTGPAVAAAGLANLAALLAGGRYFAQRVLVGGFLYGIT